MFTPEQMNVVKFCAEECVRQQKTDPMSTYNMVEAWDFAHWNNFTAAEIQEQPKRITVDFIEKIGKLIEPLVNIGGIRIWPVFIGNERRDADRLYERLEVLIDTYYDGRLDPSDKRYGIAKTPEDVFYFEFEMIHPFGDGNGRTGKVLYNYLLNSMEKPLMPPNYWGILNP